MCPRRWHGHEAEGEILFMILDVRNHPDLNFPLLNEIEVGDAVLLKHQNDPHLAVNAGWGSRLGIFLSNQRIWVPTLERHWRFLVTAVHPQSSANTVPRRNIG